MRVGLVGGPHPVSTAEDLLLCVLALSFVLRVSEFQIQFMIEFRRLHTNPSE